ncbi:thyrotropin subunit beta isoform X4 [Engystomops pustulosus]|uniref:thyrotropin subunit beta isoform X4 n=1 Tax=Engystomops pustulosus TaxID=76066 RepID=UPI003AFB2A30
MAERNHREDQTAGKRQHQGHHQMAAIFMGSLLFCIAFGHAFSLCMLTEYILYVEKEECAYCIAINTTICSGYCKTTEPNVKERQLKTISNQNVCTYRDYIHKTVSVPGCPAHVNPLYTYPVALSCKCDKCNTEYIDCVQDRIDSNYCTKPWESKYLLYKFLQ